MTIRNADYGATTSRISDKSLVVELMNACYFGLTRSTRSAKLITQAPCPGWGCNPGRTRAWSFAAARATPARADAL